MIGRFDRNRPRDRDYYTGKEPVSTPLAGSSIIGIPWEQWSPHVWARHEVDLVPGIEAPPGYAGIVASMAKGVKASEPG
jgi:hypothetical protein